jgi:hypothetical protein
VTVKNGILECKTVYFRKARCFAGTCDLLFQGSACCPLPVDFLLDLLSELEESGDVFLQIVELSSN